MEINKVFGRARIDDRLVNELIGLSRGLVADGVVNQVEAEFLHKWLVANSAVSENPIIGNLLHRVSQMLEDGVLDDDESTELLETLTRFTGGDFEFGEILKSSTLPLDEPAPVIRFDGSLFCFTGTFAFGSRRDCESAVESKGGIPCALTKKTDYLVVGVYATNAWAHSSYGRKISKALEMKNSGAELAICGEQHWLEQLGVI